MGKLVDRKGLTLVEVVVAMFLLAGMAVAMTALPLTAKVMLVNRSIQGVLKEQVHGVNNELRAYVSDADYINALSAGTTGWSLSYDSCTGCHTLGGGAGKCWALEENCTHNVSSHLPSNITAAPYNATLLYTVAVSTVNNYQIRVASFTYNYAMQ